jgi:predicted RNA-binding Zn-ribbon protein involved in translation (DUF1610 family)
LIAPAVKKGKLVVNLLFFESDERQPPKEKPYNSFSHNYEVDISRFRCPHCGSFTVEILRDEPVITGVFRIFKCKKCGKEFGRFLSQG